MEDEPDFAARLKMKLSFHGAARTVTGSRHLLEVNGRRILLDCGLFQGHRAEADRLNRHMRFEAGAVDTVILSHAHIDHSGALPALVKNGFQGPIHATPATTDLCAVMLRDSAHIQERDIETINRREGLLGNRAKKPLYTEEDAARAAKRFRLSSNCAIACNARNSSSVRGSRPSTRQASMR